MLLIACACCILLLQFPTVTSKTGSDNGSDNGSGGDDEELWNYDPCTNGPEHWPNKFPLCGTGQAQSPIDISTASVVRRQSSSSSLLQSVSSSFSLFTLLNRKENSNGEKSNGGSDEELDSGSVKLRALNLSWKSGFGKVFFNGETCQTSLDPNSLYMTHGPLKRHSSAAGGAEEEEIADEDEWSESDRYYMTQFHVHEVSEHHIDGVAYPLEIHFVHKHSTSGALAVVAFFFKVTTDQDSEFLNEFIQFCSTNNDVNNNSSAPVHNNSSSSGNSHDNISSYVVSDDETGVREYLNFGSLVSDDNGASLPYMTYQGSLTTPPCSESVTWILIHRVFSVSRSQLRQFMSILPHHLSNNRPIQDLNQRTVLMYVPPGSQEIVVTWSTMYKMQLTIALLAIGLGFTLLMLISIVVHKYIVPALTRRLASAPSINLAVGRLGTSQRLVNE